MVAEGGLAFQHNIDRLTCLFSLIILVPKTEWTTFSATFYVNILAVGCPANVISF